MPDKYIKLEDAIYLIANLSAWHGSEGSWIYQKDALDKLKTIPSANVEPVKHGRWKVTILDGPMGMRPRAFYCDSCYLIETVRTPYCPNCGAKMKKEEDDEE